MTTSNDLRKGMVLKIDGELYAVLFYQHHKPGKGGAVVRTKLRNIKRDTVIEKTFKADEPLEDVTVETRQMQLLYEEGDNYVFMDLETYEQFHVPKELAGEGVKYLKNEMICEASMYEGEIILIEPPMFVELEVVETDPGVRGDTVSGGSKPAKLETGAVIQVPLFVSIGDKVKVDTRDDRYIERVK
ncbi:MAG: elongation factor P [Brevinematia bacterium]